MQQKIPSFKTHLYLNTLKGFIINVMMAKVFWTVLNLHKTNLGKKIVLVKFTNGQWLPMGR